MLEEEESGREEAKTKQTERKIVSILMGRD